MQDEMKQYMDAIAGVVAQINLNVTSLNRLLQELKSQVNDRPYTPNIIDAPVTLTRTEQRIFEALAQRAGQIVPFEDVAKAVNMGRNRKDTFTAESLWVHMNRLREKGCNVACVKGRGYMLEVVE